MSETLRPPPSPGGGRSTREARRVGVKARAARCESLHRRAPHPASLRAATLPLQGRVKTEIRSPKTEAAYYIRTMSIEDIEKAVAGLPPDQYAEFRAWFDAFEADRFDRKIERDAQAGKLDQFANEAQQWHSLANSKNP
jgi:hypothetical protein